MDRRSEPRRQADFAVTVWGVDTRGERFLQEARACDISISGALLSGIEVDLRCGDVIGLLYQGRKARYRVVWVRCDDGGDKIQAAGFIELSQMSAPGKNCLPEKRQRAKKRSLQSFLPIGARSRFCCTRVERAHQFSANRPDLEPANG